MPTDCSYLYGVVPSGSRDDYGPIGIGGAHVRIVQEGPIAMVAGAVEKPDFSQLPPERALQCLAEHQRVLERVMTDSPVIPLKFGSVARDDRQIADILRAGRAGLARALEQYAGKIEMDLSAFWADLDATLAEIANDQAVVSMKNDIAARGDASMDQRLRLGQLVKQLLDRRRGEIASDLVVSLRSQWRGVAVNAAHDDSVVLNAAVLIDRSDEQRFDEAAEQISRRYEGRLRLRRVGPLPPYSFATAETETVGADALGAARRALELGDSASLVEIKAAYRRLLRAYHPDGNPDPEAPERIKEITAAYGRLEQYVLNFRHALTAGADGVAVVRIRSLADLQAETAANAA